MKSWTLIYVNHGQKMMLQYKNPLVRMNAMVVAIVNRQPDYGGKDRKPDGYIAPTCFSRCDEKYHVDSFSYLEI